MKQKIVLSVILSVLLIFSLGGCRSQSDIISSSDISSIFSKVPSYTSSVSSSSSSPIPESSEIPVSQPESNWSQTGECNHSYKRTVVDATCTTDGYTEHICTLCGNSYKNETTQNYHEGIKYVCDRCGHIAPDSNKLWAINAWISIYGKENGNGNLYCYPNDSAALQMSTPPDQNRVSFTVDDTASGIYFSINLDSSEFCELVFHGYEFTTHGYATVKKSSFSEIGKLTFDEFHTSQDNPVDQDVFATECGTRLNSYMQKIQNELLKPKTGLSLADFGIRGY